MRNSRISAYASAREGAFPSSRERFTDLRGLSQLAPCFREKQDASAPCFRENQVEERHAGRGEKREGLFHGFVGQVPGEVQGERFHVRDSPSERRRRLGGRDASSALHGALRRLKDLAFGPSFIPGPSYRDSD